MKQVFNFGGKTVVEEVPSPACGANEVTVQNMFSVISAASPETCPPHCYLRAPPERSRNTAAI